MESQAKPQLRTPFGELLKCYRLAEGLTQEELAERAGLSERGLRYLERGLRRPYRDTAERLAQALRLTDEDRWALRVAARPAKPSAVPGAEHAGERPLPVPPSPLIGREGEVAAVIALLRRDDVRVLTLTGTGGVGKTRLALEVAALQRPAFAGTVVWVPLASLADANLVQPAIAQALGLIETGALPLRETLTIALRDRQVLLLLDNFEHVAARRAVRGRAPGSLPSAEGARHQPGGAPDPR